MHFCLSVIFAEVVDFTTTVKEKELPFTATVCSVSPLSDTLHGNLTGETLTFLSIKDTSFLRANSISHGASRLYDLRFQPHYSSSFTDVAITIIVIIIIVFVTPSMTTMLT